MLPEALVCHESLLTVRIAAHVGPLIVGHVVAFVLSPNIRPPKLPPTTRLSAHKHLSSIIFVYNRIRVLLRVLELVIRGVLLLEHFTHDGKLLLEVFLVRGEAGDLFLLFRIGYGYRCLSLLYLVQQHHWIQQTARWFIFPIWCSFRVLTSFIFDLFV